jgi:hypothetical protein
MEVVINRKWSGPDRSCARRTSKKKLIQLQYASGKSETVFEQPYHRLLSVQEAVLQKTHDLSHESHLAKNPGRLCQNQSWMATTLQFWQIIYSAITGEYRVPAGCPK